MARNFAGGYTLTTHTAPSDSPPIHPILTLILILSHHSYEELTRHPSSRWHTHTHIHAHRVSNSNVL